MSSGLQDYLSALQARDEREHAHADYIKAYTKLADRTASLAQAAQAAPESSTSTLTPSKSGRPSTPKGKGKAAVSTDDVPVTVTQLRADLASTQKARITLESRVAHQNTELEALKAEMGQQSKRLAVLEKTKEQLERRLKDQQEELKGKGRLVETVQDDMVALTLQLNMAEQKAEKLKAENEELTKRWLEKMEREAQEMNTRSKW